MHALFNCQSISGVWLADLLPTREFATARNQKLWSNVPIVPTAICKETDAYHSAWRRFGMKASPATSKHQQVQHVRPFHLTCQVDAAWSSPGEASYGLVLLSNNSEFIATANGRLHGALDPFMADVMAF
nr:uncharacterized protein LOC109164760 [Ipomoea batatas]